ncbi:hypothetical protein IAE19_16290 [Acinetobacter sp. S40]|uniref:hypothetical protein n=1 Tax=Acinetobacter sp. S40 TaxID=2767434 RepID=UPI00190B0F52|nr:hypothetical protein [Acinetobacter sp. S40]MBJ9986991.1 hypothetical protein [Acinetobacter sp. S40]
MPALILTARSASSFSPDTLMTLINCIPGTQKPSVQDLITLYPNPIRIELTDGAFETTAIRIFQRLNSSFDIQYA